jgi:hypothetical protein
MSKYFDGKSELFMEPKTSQYGSHMVMTNVCKETKTKYINIDTRFRDDYNHSATVNYNITLPERITEAKTMTVTNVEIPNTIYNISAARGNNNFTVMDLSTNVVRNIILADNFYSTVSSLVTSVNTQLSGASVSLALSATGNNLTFTSTSTNDLSLGFAIDASGNFDKYGLRSKLGWLMGFRNINYTLKRNATITTEALSDLNGPRYLYLAIDEFCKGNQHSFISPLPHSFINKNILVRISVDGSIYGFGHVINVSSNHGSLISDVRSYTGKVDLQKLNVQLLDEWGQQVNLNGLDFSFCLQIEHE